MDNFQIPRLAVGSHKAGSGKGCAMNIQSWINGDKQITDLPACSDRFLARTVQRVNDTYCTHRDGDLLCAPCSVEVLALSHKTRGTVISTGEAVHIYVAIARMEAKYAAECAAKNAESAAESAAKYVEYAESSAKYAAECAVKYVECAKYVEYAAKNAESAAEYAAKYAAECAAVSQGDIRMTQAHRIIDKFREMAGLGSVNTQPEIIEYAVTKMLERV